MSEIAKCQCGAEARLSPPWSGRIRAVCVNDECDIRGPRALSEVEAVARWNALMRPRPVARWSDDGGAMRRLMIHGAHLGYILRGFVDSAPVCHAVCGLTGEGRRFQGDDVPSARAWLEARVRAAGFEVREEVSDE